jgi:hypothetical protein
MLIKLHIQSLGFHLQTLLSPEALPELIALAQKYRVTDITEIQRHRQALGGPVKRHHPESGDARTISRSPEGETIAARFTALEIEALSPIIATLTYPEKFLIALAWLESRPGNTQAVHRGITKRTLAQLGHEVPANPARDIKAAIDQGWLEATGDRCLVTTDAGWQKAASLLG